MTDEELNKLIGEFLPYPSKDQHYALRSFARIVAAAEREACTKVCNDWKEKCNTYMELHDAVVKDSDRLYALNAELVEALKAMQSYAAAEGKGLRICDEALRKAQGDNND